jgi:hypothetical protein
MGLSLRHLLRYADEGEDILNRIVADDESWVHHNKIKSKCFNAMVISQFTFNQKFQVTASAGKVKLIVFWDSEGVLLAHFQKRVENVNPASYCEFLLMDRDALRRSLPDELARGDNARPRTARATQERIQELQWELLGNPP